MISTTRQTLRTVSLRNLSPETRRIVLRGVFNLFLVSFIIPLIITYAAVRKDDKDDNGISKLGVRRLDWVDVIREILVDQPPYK